MKMTEILQLNEGATSSFNATAITKNEMISLLDKMRSYDPNSFAVNIGKDTTAQQLKKGVVAIEYDGFKPLGKSSMDAHFYDVDINHDVLEKSAGFDTGLTRHRVSIHILKSGQIGVSVGPGKKVK